MDFSWFDEILDPKNMKIYKEFCKELFSALLLSKDFALFRLGYRKGFDKIKEEDPVLIRYNIAKKIYPNKLEHLQITKDVLDINQPDLLKKEILNGCSAKKEIQINEEIIGTVLKKWHGSMPLYYKPGDSSEKFIHYFTGLAILGEDTIYIFYDFDQLYGLEIMLLEDNMKDNFFKRLKNYLKLNS